MSSLTTPTRTMVPDSPFDSAPQTRSLRQPLVYAVTFLMLLILALLTCQTASAIAAVSLAPVYVRFPTYAFLFLIMAALLWVFLKIAADFATLATSPRIPASVNDILISREAIREDIAKGLLADARAELEVFLGDFDRHRIRHLAALGAQEHETTQLNSLRDWLLNAECTDERWLGRLEEYLRVLDQVANRRKHYYMRRVFSATTILPNGALDTLAVLWCTFAVIRDVCRIYNVKPSLRNTATLLVHCILNAGAAHIAGELTSSAADTMEAAAETAVAGLVGCIKRAGGRLAEGAANSVLLYKLTERAIRSVRPLHDFPLS